MSDLRKLLLDVYGRLPNDAETVVDAFLFATAQHLMKKADDIVRNPDDEEEMLIGHLSCIFPVEDGRMHAEKSLFAVVAYTEIGRQLMQARLEVEDV